MGNLLPFEPRGFEEDDLILFTILPEQLYAIYECTGCGGRVATDAGKPYEPRLCCEGESQILTLYAIDENWMED